MLFTEDPVRQEYLSTVADMELNIELFTPDLPKGHGLFRSLFNEELHNESAVERASQRGLDVESVYCTPLLSGCSSSGARARADKVFDAQFGFQDQDSAKDANDGSMNRYSYFDSLVFFFIHRERTQTRMRIYSEDANNWSRHSETPDFDSRRTRTSTVFRT